MIVIDYLYDRGEGDLDDLTVGAFNLYTRRTQSVRGLHTSHYPTDAMAVGGNDFDIAFAVQRPKGCQGSRYFHSSYPEYEKNIPVRTRFSKWRQKKKSQPNISSSRILFASSFDCRINFQYGASAKFQCLRARRPILRPMRLAHAERDAVLPLLR